MKLIKCLDCGDMVALRPWFKECKCGSSAGFYLEDKTIAVSGNCKILGVPNDCMFEIPRDNEFVSYKGVRDALLR